MRTFSPATLAALASGADVQMLGLLEMLSTPVVRLNTTPNAVPVNGVSYLGAGTLGNVSSVDSAPGDLQALKFEISGVPTDTISLALQDDVRGALTTWSVAIVDPASNQVSDVVQLYAGTVDQMPIVDGRDRAAIGVTVIHRGETFNRPKPLRNTDGDQQKLAPGDTSRRFVVSQAGKQDVWPAASYYRKG